MPAFTQIKPRQLQPALFELDGISRASIEAHHRLYQGYVAKRNEILERLETVERGDANQVYSDLRALKVDLSFAIGGIKNHELYFAHLGGAGGDPTGAIAELIARDFGSAEAWQADLKATGLAARGWAWTAYDWDEHRLFNLIGDAQNTYPIWNATPLVALDVYEHAYFLDFQTDRGAYIDAFFANLDWQAVNGWIETYSIPGRNLDPMIVDVLIVAGGYLVGSIPFGLVIVRLFRGEDIRRHGSGNIGASNVWRVYGRWLGVPVALLDVAKGFVPALIGLKVGGEWVGVLAGAAAMVGHARPLWLGFARGGKMVATGGGVSLALAPIPALLCLVIWLVAFVLFRYASLASLATAAALPLFCLLLGEPWPTVAFACGATLAVFVLHRQNIRRLLSGTESRFSRGAARA